MIRAFCMAACCGVLFFMPSIGHAQKKKDPNARPPVADPGTADDYAQLNKQDKVEGKLITFERDVSTDVKAKKGLSFRYDYEVTDSNPNYKPTKVPKARDFTKDWQSLQARIVAANNNPNLQQRMAALQQLAIQQQQLMQNMAQEQINQAAREAQARDNDTKNGNVPYIKVARAKEFELEIQNNVVLRRLKPPMEYDDKGFLKGAPEGDGFTGYTKEELKKWRLVDNKDGKLPGFPAKLVDLRPNQVLTLYLTPGKKVEKSAKKDKADADAEPAIPVRPSIRMIVIVEDVANSDADDPNLPPLKKKKK
jgi:hypothetical protein